MITFYENNPQNQMRYQQRKPDELSFLSDDEDDATLGFNKNKRMSQLTATDSAYFSESSNQATTLISPTKEIASPTPSPHHNVILWQKQQQQYQKQNNVLSPNITPTPSFENGNDLTSINPLDTMPHIDEWETQSSDNNSVKSGNLSKLRYPSPRGPNELSYNSPEQRTQRIQLRMSQWKEKMELMSASSAVSSSSSVVGYSGRSSPNPNLNGNFRRGLSNRHSSFSSSIDMDNGFDQPFSSARSVYSVNSLPNSVFDEKYDSFAEDDRESVFSLRSSNFHSNYNPNSNAYIPPRSRSSLEVRNHHKNSRIYSSGSIPSPLKESRIHIMQAELENSQRIYKQKLQQINQMKQDIEQYQYKLEEIREKEIEQARKETIEELEATVIKNLKLEIEALQNKLQDTTRELEHSKAYSDMLRNELITLKMNEQVFKDDDDNGNDNDEVIGSKESEQIKYTNNEIKRENIQIEDNTLSNNSQQDSPKNSELQRLEMLERELKKKNEEIIELKKKLDKSTKLNELSKREIELLNRKVENHKQAREDIEKRHTKLVDVASANEIELNKLRYKLDMITQRQDKALRKMQRRYSSILEVEEEEEEVVSLEDNIDDNVNIDDDINVDDSVLLNNKKEIQLTNIHEEDKEDITAVEKGTLSETLNKNDKNQIENNSNNTEILNTLDDTINDILDLSDLEENSLSGSDNINSDNLEEILNQLDLSDLDIDDEEDIDLNNISFDDETLMI